METCFFCNNSVWSMLVYNTGTHSIVASRGNHLKYVLFQQNFIKKINRETILCQVWRHVGNKRRCWATVICKACFMLNFYSFVWWGHTLHVVDINILRRMNYSLLYIHVYVLYSLRYIYERTFDQFATFLSYVFDVNKYVFEHYKFV